MKRSSLEKPLEWQDRAYALSNSTNAFFLLVESLTYNSLEPKASIATSWRKNRGRGVVWSPRDFLPVGLHIPELLESASSPEGNGERGRQIGSRLLVYFCPFSFCKSLLSLLVVARATLETTLGDVEVVEVTGGGRSKGT